MIYRGCICTNVCIRVAVSGGAKWVSTRSREDLCSWHISATLHDRGERESMYPCSVNYDPSLSLSLALSLHILLQATRQDSDDLMMRETTWLFIQSRQVRRPCCWLRKTHTFEHSQTRMDKGINTPTANSEILLMLGWPRCWITLIFTIKICCRLFFYSTMLTCSHVACMLCHHI